MKLCIKVKRLLITAFGSGQRAFDFKKSRLEKMYKGNKLIKMMNEDLTNFYLTSGAVKADQIIYQPDHLGKFIKQDQKTIDMMSALMEISVNKDHSLICKGIQT